MLIEIAVLVEPKAAEVLDSIHNAQCLNYPKATGMLLCLLLDFGNHRLKIRRFVNGL
ncbi:MAG: GxxExxY protein [Rhodopila sp.]|nr:GxxExxY protein [Rhodopila sp.]